MNPQYQGAQGQGPMGQTGQTGQTGQMGQTYYQPSYVADDKEVATGYPPVQQPFTNWHGHNNTGTNNSPQPAVYAHDPPVAPKSSWVRRSTCIALLVATIILLAAVIGLGAGLGVSQRDLHNTQADLANARATASPSAATTAVVTAVVTATAAPTGSPTSSSASASATADVSNITCPKGNNTLYTASGSSKQFRESCGIDYGDGEADPVGSVKTTSMDACMDACAAQDGCTGAGWGYLDGDVGLEHSCYMKANLTTPHAADQGWAFGVLLTGSGSGKRGWGA